MEQDNKQKTKGRWKLFAVIAICAAPLVASYMFYFVIKPEGRTNYGTILDPRAYPVPALGYTTLDGQPVSLEEYKGKWIMLLVDDAGCEDDCKRKLYNLRQLRLAQGKDRDRIERLWLITDDKPLETLLIREYDGTRMIRAKPELVRNWLPVEPDTTVADHIYMIDPLGNLMMRFPKDADPNKIKNDLSKLLKASRIG